MDSVDGFRGLGSVLGNLGWVIGSFEWVDGDSENFYALGRRFKL